MIFFSLDHQERRKMAEKKGCWEESFPVVPRRFDSKQRVNEVVFNISIELGGEGKLW